MDGVKMDSYVAFLLGMCAGIIVALILWVIFRPRPIDLKPPEPWPITADTGEPRFLVTNEGWYDEKDKLHEWLDIECDGRYWLKYQRLDVYEIINGEILFTSIPPLSTILDDCKHWSGFLKKGTFHFIYSRYDGETTTVKRKIG